MILETSFCTGLAQEKHNYRSSSVLTARYDIAPLATTPTLYSMKLYAKARIRCKVHGHNYSHASCLPFINYLASRYSCAYVDVTASNHGEYGNLCQVDCSNRGICDYSTGKCTCFDGSWGVACEQRLGTGGTRNPTPNVVGLS
jgi:hypothetical protein